MKPNITYDKSKEFAIRIIRLYQFLSNTKKEFILSKQVLKSGTSIGANYAEAIYGISKKDFLSKAHIALKECAETKYWLELLYATDYITESQYKSIDQDCTELIKIFTTITKNASQSP